MSLYNETKGEGIYPTPVLGIVGILDDVTKAVPAHFQPAATPFCSSGPSPRAKSPIRTYPFPSIPSPRIPRPASSPVFSAMKNCRGRRRRGSSNPRPLELLTFGSSEYAKVVLGGVWGQPPPLDLDAEADLHTLLAVLADRHLLSSARDLADGGLAVALAQAAFPLDIGATVEQDQSLMVHPLFGLFAEPASTMLVSAAPSQVADIEELADQYGYFVARIGTTGGDHLEINVYRQPMISASLESLRKPWATSLEATLHNEVTA